MSEERVLSLDESRVRGRGGRNGEGNGENMCVMIVLGEGKEKIKNASNEKVAISVILLYKIWAV